MREREREGERERGRERERERGGREREREREGEKDSDREIPEWVIRERAHLSRVEPLPTEAPAVYRIHISNFLWRGWRCDREGKGVFVVEGVRVWQETWGREEQQQQKREEEQEEEETISFSGAKTCARSTNVWIERQRTPVGALAACVAGYRSRCEPP